MRYGLHRQDAAMMTCFTPSALRSDHVHFIDGARGGYASAATALKAISGVKSAVPSASSSRRRRARRRSLPLSACPGSTSRRCCIGAAVIGIVDLPGPSVRAGGLHAAEQRQARSSGVFSGPDWDSCRRPGACRWRDRSDRVSQTTTPQIPPPHLLTRTLASPAWVSQMPVSVTAVLRLCGRQRRAMPSAHAIDEDAESGKS